MTSKQNVEVARALISVSDKEGVVEFARALAQRDVAILSTGGTASLLQSAGIEVTDVSDHTGFDEIMDGRVKTLHPRVHGGILGRRDVDRAVMEDNDIPPIDMVVVNLYPFEQTVARPDCNLAMAIENIDIGGPAMLRAAAKNHAWVTVIVDQADYGRVLEQLDQNAGTTTEELRFDLAVKAFEHTARYDGAIAQYLGASEQLSEAAAFPRTWNNQYQRRQLLRYGENPHQSAAFYVSASPADESVTVSSAQQLQGKPMSYNNIADTDAALECVKQFGDGPACVIVKHANPCGVAVANDLESAYQRAFKTDPESAFGGIIAFNQPLDATTARAIIEQQFVEVIIAPGVDNDAAKVLAEKDNVRLLCTASLDHAANDGGVRYDSKLVAGGLLVQQADVDLWNELKVVTRVSPDKAQMRDLKFAWRVAKFVKSNAIIYAREEMTVGVGAGQMSRVNSARIAAIKAGHAGLEVKGAVMASDAFFPFRDGLDQAGEAGIAAVIQPGGSMRDDEVIAAADEHGITMVFTGMRHFRH